MLMALALLASIGSTTADAATIAIIDFQRAVTETEEGKNAQVKLDTMYGSKKAEIEKMESELTKEIEDYKSRALILSEDARAEAEQNLGMKQQRFQATVMQYEQEMQQTYFTLLQDLDVKMRAMAEEIAKEKAYDLVVDRAAVVYYGGDTVDMTGELIKRYNAK